MMKHLYNYIKESLLGDAYKKRFYKYIPKDKADLKILIKTIPINEWDLIDTSGIDDMSNLFYGYLGKFGDMSSWDVSNVKDMSRMFAATRFNGDISKWDVSSVENMHQMFCASDFNGDISEWDVSSVKSMRAMFYDAAFDGNLSKWDVSNVKDMRVMFANSNFTGQKGNLSKWAITNVEDITNMFASSRFSGDLSNWDVSKCYGNDRAFTDCPITKYPKGINYITI